MAAILDKNAHKIEKNDFKKKKSTPPFLDPQNIDCVQIIANYDHF